MRWLPLTLVFLSCSSGPQSSTEWLEQSSAWLKAQSEPNFSMPRFGAPAKAQKPVFEAPTSSEEKRRAPQEQIRFRPRPDIGFLGAPEGARRYELFHEPIVFAKKGTGGRSLGFKLTLKNRSKGYFKPEQSFSAARWFSEVAAYHLDRQLRIGRVPTIVARKVPYPKIERAAADDKRLSELRVRDNLMSGAFVSWIEGGLEPLDLGRDWERWIRIDEMPEITPFQRPANYVYRLKGVRQTSLPIGKRELAPEEPPNHKLPAILSDLVVFDFLTQNADRWGGDFTNLRVNRDGEIIFLDNAAGFPPYETSNLMLTRLQTCQRFRRQTYAALKRFDLKEYKARLDREAVQPILSDDEFESFAARIPMVTKHIEAMVKTHGDQVFFDQS